MGFTSPTFVLLDLFPHLRLLTFCLASSLGIGLAILRLQARLYLNRRSALLLLQSSLASALQLATPAFEQSACRVTRKVLLFCVCWFSFDKAKKKTQKRKKRGKKIAPTADMGCVLWQINDLKIRIVPLASSDSGVLTRHSIVGSRPFDGLPEPQSRR